MIILLFDITETAVRESEPYDFKLFLTADGTPYRNNWMPYTSDFYHCHSPFAAQTCELRRCLPNHMTLSHCACLWNPVAFLLAGLRTCAVTLTVGLRRTPSVLKRQLLVTAPQLTPLYTLPVAALKRFSLQLALFCIIFDAVETTRRLCTEAILGRIPSHRGQ